MTFPSEHDFALFLFQLFILSIASGGKCRESQIIEEEARAKEVNKAIMAAQMKPR